MPKKLGLSEVISRLKSKYGNDYDYSNIDYKKMRDYITIICPKHGKINKTLEFLLSKNGCLCKECNKKFTKHMKITTKVFIEKAKEIHGDKYDYSLAEYKNQKIKVKIICNKCKKVFEQFPVNHIRYQHGCPNCCLTKKKTVEQFIEKAKEIHGDKYDYSLVEYKNTWTKIKIICQAHGEFFQKPMEHLRGHGCLQCALERNKSKGCKVIEQFLEENQILFEREKKYDDCIGRKKKLPFDYFLPIQNILIEFDGEQHCKKKFKMSDKDFEELQKNDKIKNEYCKKHNINLIRISYLDFDNIDDILYNEIIKKKGTI